MANSQVYCYYILRPLTFIIICITMIIAASNASLANAVLTTNNKSANEIAKRKAIEDKQIFEANGVADTLCRVIGFFTSEIARAIAGFMVIMIGIGTYFGHLNIGMVASMAIGLALFFGVISLVGVLAPFSDISAGCNCKTSMVLGRDVNGNAISSSTNLNGDCSKKV